MRWINHLLLLCCISSTACLYAQVHLTIVNEHRLPLQDVRIQTQDGTFSATSNQDGTLQFPNLANDVVVSVKYANYRTSELSFANLKHIKTFQLFPEGEWKNKPSAEPAEYELLVLNEHHRPISGAFVYTKDGEQIWTTDESGKVGLPKLSDRSLLYFVYPAYRTRELLVMQLRGVKEIQLFRGESPIPDFLKARLKGEILTVVDEAQKPIKSALVYTQDHSFEGKTDAKGTVVIPPLALDQELWISAKAYRVSKLTYANLQNVRVFQLFPDKQRLKMSATEPASEAVASTTIGSNSLLLTNEHREPLSGVNVYARDDSFSGITDEKGHVLVPAYASKKILYFSYPGYRKRELLTTNLQGVKELQLFPEGQPKKRRSLDFYQLPNKTRLTLVNEMDEPMIGVAVFTHDYSFKAITDETGQVEIPRTIEDVPVYFNYLGYEEQAFSYRTLVGLQQLQLFPDIKDLNTVVVVGRRDDKAQDLPYEVEAIDAKEIALSSAQTSADALEDNANVFIQKSQMGGGSPILRGFEANKVLLVLDGVRLNNAIYRNGHLQNAITVDPAMLDRLEVIYGPGSLTYGSDALGGVVHFRSRMPKLSYTKDRLIQVNAYARFATANEENSFHVDYNYGRKKWASLTSATYSEYGDLRAGSKRDAKYPEFGKTPFYVETNSTIDGAFDQVVENKDPNIQVGTKYWQLDLLQKYRYQPNEDWNFTLNLQFSSSSDIPRYDQLTVLESEDPRDLKFAEWYYGPQERLLASTQVRLFKETALYDRANFIAAFQKINEDRHQRKLGSNNRRFNLEDVFVYSLTADFDLDLNHDRRHTLSYGLEVNYNDVRSEAGNDNIFSTTRTYNEPTRYPSGGSNMTTTAAYTNYRWKSRDSTLQFHTGLRYTYTDVHSLFGENDPIQWTPSYYTTGVGNTDGDLTYGIGLTLNTPSGWQVRLASASSFRSPNLDDFSKVRAKNGFVTIPNPDLDSERALNGEFTIGKVSNIGKNKLQLSATAFYTHLDNAIVRTDFALPDGTNTLLLDGETLQTQANINAETAYIHGFSGNLRFNFAQHWMLQSGINYTYGRQNFSFGDTEIETPLAHIPPLYGRSSLRYKTNKWTLEAVVRYNGQKLVEDYAVRQITTNDLGETITQRDGTADNLEYTAPCFDETYCEGTPAWTTFNFYGSYQLTKHLTINFAAENIADTHYRPFASGLSAAGRNTVISVRAKF